jgi:hypothetical protein
LTTTLSAPPIVRLARKRETVDGIIIIYIQDLEVVYLPSPCLLHAFVLVPL